MYQLSPLITGIMNAYKGKKQQCMIPLSSFLVELLTALYKEGYIEGFQQKGSKIQVFLKYKEGQPFIKRFVQKAKPSRSFHYSQTQLARLQAGLTTTFFATSHGILSGREMKYAGIGGILLCEIS